MFTYSNCINLHNLEFKKIIRKVKVFFHNMLPWNVLLGMIGNIGSTVGIVFCNKYLFQIDQFHFTITLCCMHFVCTALWTRILSWKGCMKPVHISPYIVAPVACFSLASVIFMNLNLAYNSMGFYQLTKIMCIPVTIFIESYIYSISTSIKIKWTLIPIFLGIALATISEIHLSLHGIGIGFLAILSTVFSQIYTSRVQKQNNITSMALLYHTSIYMIFGSFFAIPLLDNVDKLSSFYLMTTTSINSTHLRLLLSCGFAIGVNFSNYFILGKTSPITYQVIGHFKTICILILGFLYFEKVFVLWNLLGIGIALIGVIWYSEIKRQDAYRKKNY